MGKFFRESNHQEGRALLLGVTTAIFCGFICLLLFSWIMIVKDFGETTVMIIANCILGVASISGGYVSSMKLKRHGLKTGMVVGGLCVLILLLCGLFGNSFAISFQLLIKSLITVLGGGIGGVLGVNRAGKRKL